MHVSIQYKAMSSAFTWSAQKTVIISVVLGFLLLLLAVFAGLKQTYYSAQLVKQYEIEAAATSARSSLPVARVLSAVTLGKNPDIELWKNGLLVITELPANLAHFSPFVAENGSPNQLILSLKNSIDLLQQLPDRWWLQRWQPTLAAQLATFAAEAEIIEREALSGDHRYLVIFQNSDELRATGGFMGSYAQLALRDGQIQSVDIQDIYVPDGQFTGFVEAPPGVKEYLSSGKGLRLPDANWWPDFPSSAQKILPFFALGKEQAFEGVIAINLEVMKQLLQITGPVYMPDYQTTVSAENVAEVARADRSEFFPGSVAKPHFLSNLFTILKFKLRALTPAQKKELLTLIRSDLRNKNIQIYSNLPELQAVLSTYQLTGEVKTPSDHPFLFLVESNVGINKANRDIIREVHITLTPALTSITIDFYNRNSAELNAAGHYINYQRLLLPPSAQIRSITYHGKTVHDWDSEIVTAESGQSLLQVGFLLEVPAKTDRQVVIELAQSVGKEPLEYLIQKQAGLPPVPYTVSWQGQPKSFLLEKDELITW